MSFKQATVEGETITPQHFKEQLREVVDHYPLTPISSFADLVLSVLVDRKMAAVDTAGRYIPRALGIELYGQTLK